MQRLTDAEREHALAALPAWSARHRAGAPHRRHCRPLRASAMTAQRAQAATCARWQKLAQDSAKPRHGALGVHVCQNKATPHERRTNHFYKSINKKINLFRQHGYQIIFTLNCKKHPPAPQAGQAQGGNGNGRLQLAVPRL